MLQLVCFSNGMTINTTHKANKTWVDVPSSTRRRGRTKISCRFHGVEFYAQHVGWACRSMKNLLVGNMTEIAIFSCSLPNAHTNNKSYGFGVSAVNLQAACRWQLAVSYRFPMCCLLIANAILAPCLVMSWHWNFGNPDWSWCLVAGDDHVIMRVKYSVRRQRAHCSIKLALTWFD